MRPIIFLVVRLYRLALRRYPAELRRKYEAEMTAAAREKLRTGARRAGWKGLATAALDLAVDLARPLPGLRIRNREGRASESDGPRTGGRETGWWTGWTEDLAHAARGLRRDPRFAVLAVGVLGAGIALFVAVFAVVNAYLLRPLPFPEADRIVSVRGTMGAVGWQDVDEVFEKAVSWDLDVFILLGEGPARVTTGAWVTADFLETYGIEPSLGRIFTPDEAAPGGPQVAMISHRLWAQRFASDPSVLGTTFSAYTSDRPDHAGSFTIVGVLPEDFWYFNEYTDVLVPIRENRAVYVGRLREDVPLARAEEYVEELARAEITQIPEDFDVELVPLQEQHTASARSRLMLFLSAVGLVLLIACANVAVLLLVRSVRRQRELGVRRALGAARWRLARQLLFEGLCLALAAGALGALLAGWGLSLAEDGVQTQVGASVPGGVEALRIDPLVLLATVGVSAVVGIAFGLVPLVASGSGTLAGTLGSEIRGGSESKRNRRFRSALVVVEVGVSLALLVGAGLVVRSAIHLQRLDPGFEAAGLERGVVGLRAANYSSPDEIAAFHDRLLARVGTLPGVESVGMVSQTPFSGRAGVWEVEGEGGRTTESHSFRVAGPYFRTIGAPLIRGRSFTPRDTAGALPVAMVSRGLAESVWPDEDPLGKRIRVLPFMADREPGDWRTVVGVVEDVRHEVESEVAGDLWVPNRQVGSAWMTVVARTRERSAPVMPRVESLLQELDSEASLSSVGRIEDQVDRALAPARFTAWMLGIFSVLAAVLTVVGLYGVVAYTARQGRRDVAIRMALGADRSRATSPLLRRGVGLVLAGVLVGMVGGFLLAGRLEEQIFGISPYDPLIHGGVAMGLLLTALVAVWLPTRAVARTRPSSVLREE